MKAPKVTLKEVEAYGAKWVPRLHLQDWQIHYEISNCGDAAGTCRASWIKQMAWIKIDKSMPNNFFKGDNLGVREGRRTEAVVMHELLHILEEPNYGFLVDRLEKKSRLHGEVLALRERMIDQFVRVLLEADAAGAWGA